MNGRVKYWFAMIVAVGVPAAGNPLVFAAHRLWPGEFAAHGLPEDGRALYIPADPHVTTPAADPAASIADPVEDAGLAEACPDAP